MNKQDCCGQCSQEAPFDYIEQAHVTCSDKFYGERVAFDIFKHELNLAIHLLGKLDLVKKSLFYGKGAVHATADDDNNLADIPTYVGYDYEAGRNIIHAIIGIATEAGELLDALYATVIDGKSFDVVNIEEETGDIFWYIAILAKACGFDFEQCQRKNIAKLRMRYGEKFSEFDANNRNLKAERSILEAQWSEEEIAAIEESISTLEQTCFAINKICAMTDQNMSVAQSAIAMTMPPNLHETTDASVWAKEFKSVCERLTEPERLDEGFLIGWFANAIEVGRAAGFAQSKE